MNARDLKDLFINFFVSKGHVEIPSASLVPENDSTTLFISAGMHPLVPFLLGQPHPLGKRLTDVQKSLRTGDIDEVGDNCHHTFFEMLGNWSLGDYFKESMIPWSFDFLVNHLKYDPKVIHVTCFEGDQDAPKDEESFNLWLKCGIPEERIHYLPKTDNWWGPAGVTGPCGPDTEMFIDLHPEKGFIDFKTGCKQGRIIEIGNDVFMQYNKTSDAKYILLPQKNVDTGWGVERNLAVISGFDDDYLTSIWQPIIKKIEELSGKVYGSDESTTRCMRIIADHIRSAVFVISDGVEPSNKERGYVLRRLIRRSIRQGKLIGIQSQFLNQISSIFTHRTDIYAGDYPNLVTQKQKIYDVLEQEEKTFSSTIDIGLKLLNKILETEKKLSGIQAFDLYQSFGFPIEMIEEELAKINLKLNRTEFETAKNAHIEQSRTLSSGKFKSGLADNSETITKYHTATHLIHAALRQILGPHVQQSGSNITSERLRFDFTHPQKLTPVDLKKVADLVNQKIDQAIPVTVKNMKFIEAQKLGALAFFGAKYPEIVSVYSVGDYSMEVCTGPHVTNTSLIGKISISKEESAGSGKRRLYASLIS